VLEGGYRDKLARVKLGFTEGEKDAVAVDPRTLGEMEGGGKKSCLTTSRQGDRTAETDSYTRKEVRKSIFGVYSHKRKKKKEGRTPYDIFKSTSLGNASQLKGGVFSKGNSDLLCQ